MKKEELMNDKVKYIFILGAFIILSVIGYFALPRDEIVIQASEDSEEEVLNIYVHIEGCVHRPGVYEIEEGTRLYELIEIAGGETEDADLSKINLASILVDAQKVYVPESVTYPAPEDNNNLENGIVNINTATLLELQTLEGIGPSTAQKIIDYRENKGYFNKIDELKNIDGIGESKYNALKEDITI